MENIVAKQSSQPGFGDACLVGSLGAPAGRRMLLLAAKKKNNKAQLILSGH
jgi:hypothetical protein